MSLLQQVQSMLGREPLVGPQTFLPEDELRRARELLRQREEQARIAAIPTELKQAPPKGIGQRIIEKTPQPFRDVLFGQTEEFQARVGRLPETLQEQLATGGLLRDNPLFPFLTRTDAVKMSLLEQRLIKDGTEPDRAARVAAVITKSKTPIDQLKAEESLQLTPEEKSSIRKRGAAGGLGVALDIASLPTFGLLKAVKPALKVVKPVGRITKELEPFAQEARKFKSAEEFVDNKAFEVRNRLQAETGARGDKMVTLYHGTDADSLKLINQTGKIGRDVDDITFFTKSAKEAREYAQNKAKYRGGKEPAVLKVEVPAQVVRKGQQSGAGGFEYEIDGILDYADGVAKHSNENLVRTFGYDAPVKSQLTDFYNQAVKGISRKGISARDEFKVGDMLDPQGKTNMVGKVTIREITGNTLKFIDSEGTEFAGMQRSTVRDLIRGNSWKKVTPEGVSAKGVVQPARELPEAPVREAAIPEGLSEAARIEKPPIKPPIPPIAPIAPIEEVGNTIQKLIKAIDNAIPLRAEQKKLYQKELAKRTARVAQAGAKVEGEAGFFAQLGALKGELPKKSFEAIRGQFSQKEIDSLFSAIEQAKTLLPLEKVGTKEGLRKLFEGIVPTPSEIEKLREVFPKELIDGLLARRPLLERMTELAGSIVNIPRTVLASTDLSAPFRQGIFMLGRPKRFFRAFKDMFKFAVSEKAYEGLIEGIKARPSYLKMKQGGLALTEIGGPLLKREEVFMGNIIEKVPIFGRLIRASNRAYTGFLNKLRADIFDDILTKAKIVGRDTDNALLNSIADFVNAGTGRGKFGLAETGILPKSMEKAAVVMNAAFFSPRLMASRLNLLNPYFYIQLDPLVRKEAVKTLFATSGILGSVYGLWKLNGGDVGIDPRSADFGKLKIGNTRYDILGGFQQYVKLATQLITGEIISSTTGRTITLGEGFKPLTRKEIILRFFENKTSPIASFVIGLLTGTTAVGEDVDVPTEVMNRFIPMVIQDLYDISQEEGAEGLLYGLPAIFGVGVQTYGKQELVEGVSRIGEPTTQIRPVPELAEKIRELVLGQIPFGTSKGFSIETYFDQLQNLPREEAADIFDKITEANPELAKKLVDVVEERELGITVKDKDLKVKGVASGDRALAVKKELDKLKTEEERADLWDELVRKKIITTEVSRQLNLLYAQQ